MPRDVFNPLDSFLYFGSHEAVKCGIRLRRWAKRRRPPEFDCGCNRNGPMVLRPSRQNRGKASGNRRSCFDHRVRIRRIRSAFKDDLSFRRRCQSGLCQRPDRRSDAQRPAACRRRQACTSGRHDLELRRRGPPILSANSKRHRLGKCDYSELALQRVRVIYAFTELVSLELSVNRCCKA